MVKLIAVVGLGVLGWFAYTRYPGSLSAGFPFPLGILEIVGMGLGLLFVLSLPALIAKLNGHYYPAKLLKISMVWGIFVLPWIWCLYHAIRPKRVPMASLSPKLSEFDRATLLAQSKGDLKELGWIYSPRNMRLSDREWQRCYTRGRDQFLAKAKQRHQLYHAGIAKLEKDLPDNLRVTNDEKLFICWKLKTEHQGTGLFIPLELDLVERWRKELLSKEQSQLEQAFDLQGAGT